MRKAQLSFEYMMIFGLAIAFAVPVWLYVTSLQQDTGQDLSMSYAKNAVNQITSSADLVYGQGPPAKITLNVYIPSGIESVNITGRTINFRMRTSAGLSDIFSSSVANLSGTVPLEEGMYWIKVESMGDYVNVSKE
jgi:uncharacterized protein (UPF0333 family)